MGDTDTASLTMSELAERTGVAATTIHHYQRQGLLPPPERLASNRFRYGERHVQALKLIRLLRERRRLPLETIRRVLPELLTDDEHAFHLRMWDQVVAADAYEAMSRERARVLAVARASFARAGVAGVSVADICNAVGIAKGTFYGIFTSKEQLFLAAADAVVDDVVRGLEVAEPAGPLPQREIADLLDALLGSEARLLVEVALRGGHGSADDTAAADRLLAKLEAAAARRLRASAASGTAAMLVDAALGRALRRFALRRDRAQYF